VGIACNGARNHNFEVQVPFAEADGLRPPAPCWGESIHDWYFANPAAFSELGPKVLSAFIAEDWLVMSLPEAASLGLFSDRHGIAAPARRRWSRPA
jgi:hypothetical protein